MPSIFCHPQLCASHLSSTGLLAACHKATAAWLLHPLPLLLFRLLLLPLLVLPLLLPLLVLLCLLFAPPLWWLLPRMLLLPLPLLKGSSGKRSTGPCEGAGFHGGE